MTGTIFTFLLAALFLAFFIQRLFGRPGRRSVFPVRCSLFGVPCSVFPALRLFCLGVLALLFSFSARAQITYSNSITYTNIFGTIAAPTTNNGAGVLIGQARIAPPNYALSHGALLGTNDLTQYIQISLDNTNWTTIAASNPTETNNNTTDPLYLPVQNMKVYSRVVIVSTNQVQGGAILTLGAGTVFQ